MESNPIVQLSTPLYPSLILIHPQQDVSNVNNIWFNIQEMKFNTPSRGWDRVLYAQHHLLIMKHKFECEDELKKKNINRKSLLWEVNLITRRKKM